MKIIVDVPEENIGANLKEPLKTLVFTDLAQNIIDHYFGPEHIDSGDYDKAVECYKDDLKEALKG